MADTRDLQAIIATRAVAQMAVMDAEGRPLRYVVVTPAVARHVSFAGLVASFAPVQIIVDPTAPADFIAVIFCHDLPEHLRGIAAQLDPEAT